MMIRKNILLITILLLLFNLTTKSQNSEPFQKSQDLISSNEIEGWINEMVQPKYKGRLAGTPEYMEIAQWAADLFSGWGIQPYGDDGSYFQYFDRAWTEVKSSGSVVLKSGKTKRKLIAGQDYYPGANPDNGKVKGQVVFAGHGITCPEMDYDDYAKIDVKGKIVLITGDVPYKGNDSEAKSKWTFYNSHRYKFTNAYEHGALGVLIVSMMASPGTPFYKDFFYAAVHDDIARSIFEIEKLNWDSVLKDISQRMHPRSFESQTNVEITTDVVRHESGKTANIIGFIEGNDPELKNEVIVIGAHLDGQGSLGFLLPGALDNASGVADVLAAAKALIQMEGKMKRSVMIILFGGEECGLLGSLHFVKNPKIPLENILLMINLDIDRKSVV